MRPIRPKSPGGFIPPNTSRIVGPRITSRLNNNVAATPAPAVPGIKSRASSVVSSISSATTPKAPRLGVGSTITKSQTVKKPIPESTLVRKGLAKFSNPIECQRQFQALNQKIQSLNELVETKDTELGKLREQLEKSLKVGVVHAIVAQHFAKSLKLDCDVNLVDECENLKRRIQLLEVGEREYEQRLKSVVDDYKSQLKVEHDLRAKIELELEEKCSTHSTELATLKQVHTSELEDLKNEHNAVRKSLEERIESLELELKDRCKDLSEIRKDHEELTNDYNKLEESLTKDKDARVRYAQEKASQFEKDVESLNAVLEMKTERIHELEKDSLQLEEVQKKLAQREDANKTLMQQMESLNAALEKKRKQYEALIAQNEKLIQDLKRERRERRRMTMKTEELEYALSESCATESNLSFNSNSVKELDGADHVV